MKTYFWHALAITASLTVALATPVWAQTPVGTEAPDYKMTTPIPHQITTPDKVTTPIGTLEFFDGIPTRDTVGAVYDYMDRARAVQAYVNMVPAVSTYSLRQGQRDMGAKECNQILIWEKLGDSKSLVLTYNNTSLSTRTGRMRRILTEAVAMGNAYARANTVFPRDPGHRIYPDTDSEWIMAFPDKDTYFLKDGARRVDGRLWMHYNAVCVTPAMALTRPGAGSDYGIAGLDAAHRPLDGARTYKLHLPPDVPVKDNWSVTIYDPQTRCMLQTDQPFAGINSLGKGIKKNADGSIDIYFAPKAPEGMENNWIQTIPRKSWFILLRMYGPLEPWLDKSWRPGEIELVD